VPPSTLPQRRTTVFLRRDLRHKAEWVPNLSVEGMAKRLRLLCTPHVKR
jgi:hypothetical protein